MSVEAVVFPLDARRHSAAPSHLVFISSSLSGKEVRNPERDARRLRFNAAAGIKTLSDVELLIAWHAAMEGQTYGFLITDWLDYKATTAAKTLYNAGGLLVTSQGRSTAVDGGYQMEKWYTVGARTFKRKITRPKAGTVTLSTAGSFSTTTGLITGAPSAPTWTGEFYVPVRFEQHELPLELLLYRPSSDTGIGEVPEVGLIEDVE